MFAITVRVFCLPYFQCCSIVFEKYKIWNYVLFVNNCHSHGPGCAFAIMNTIQKQSSIFVFIYIVQIHKHMLNFFLIKQMGVCHLTELVIKHLYYIQSKMSQSPNPVSLEKTNMIISEKKFDFHDKVLVSK